MDNQPLSELSSDQEEVLSSIRLSKVVVPILIGIVVVIYLLFRQFNVEDFRDIEWTGRTLFWIMASLTLLVVRHLSYANRLRVLSQGDFSWKKSIELIFIWEFSSAVSPTSVGGSAVAFFVLAQEKLSAARTATIVLYTIVLDTLFFISTIPIFLLIFGTSIIRPGMTSLASMDGWAYYFLFSYVVMAVYGFLFYWGLFRSPKQIKRLLVGFTKLPFFRKYRPKMIKLGNEIVEASKELKQQNRKFHVSAFLSTVGAWTCKFLLLSALIIAFTPDLPLSFDIQGQLYARLQTMFVIIAFSPTPGGAGFVEILFSGFLSDYVTNATNATVISTIWRIFAFYAYLLAGAIIVPNWIRQRLNARKQLQNTEDERS